MSADLSTSTIVRPADDPSGIAGTADRSRGSRRSRPPGASTGSGALLGERPGTTLRWSRCLIPVRSANQGRSPDDPIVQVPPRERTLPTERRRRTARSRARLICCNTFSCVVRPSTWKSQSRSRAERAVVSARQNSGMAEAAVHTSASAVRIRRNVFAVASPLRIDIVFTRNSRQRIPRDNLPHGFLQCLYKIPIHLLVELFVRLVHSRAEKVKRHCPTATIEPSRNVSNQVPSPDGARPLKTGSPGKSTLHRSLPVTRSKATSFHFSKLGCIP